MASDGGPAFPRTRVHADTSGTIKDGMSLRDWFAGQALLAVLMAPDQVMRMAAESGQRPTQATAKISYEIADAMLAERAKEGQS